MGLCNAEELLKILREIEPEVAFEEICPSDFDSYCKDGTKWSLEAQAITRYLEFRSLRRVPVDRYDIPKSLIAESKRKIDCVFDYVEQTSQEYLELDEAKNNRAYQYGFEYLNSVGFANTMARIHAIEEQTIVGTHDQDLICGLERWRQLTQRREAEMIGNIYEYCRENVFDTGVFLVGAAHKTGIVHEIEKCARTDAYLIRWNSPMAISLSGPLCSIRANSRRWCSL